MAVPKDSAQGVTVKKPDGTIVTTSKPGDVLVSTVPAVPGKNVLPPGTLIVPAGTNAERYARSPVTNAYNYPVENNMVDPYKDLWGRHKDGRFL